MKPNVYELKDYDRTPPSKTHKKLYGNDDLTVKIFETACKSDLNMRKNCASAIKTKLLGSSSLVYDQLMRHWIETELGVAIPCVTELMDKVCWGCGEERSHLMTCKGKSLERRFLNC